ncbi:Hypothetical protein CINCED_3A004201 [Cinara cedri]|uniref:Uncharacterized protein n=1 Tax=Cinara cedri TaxID=506608 RepID=A0A5E4M401_9HEMI|nr:Hypothetical protein CINCED_3A004201 [Cinara cedri]
METYDKLVKVFGDEAPSRAQVFGWHTIFKNGRESVGDEPRSGRPVEARTEQCSALLPQAPYSPDMSPCDFFLFPQTKLAVKGTHFESITDIQNAVTRVLQDIPVEAFQKCYESWKKRWNKCIEQRCRDHFGYDHILPILATVLLRHGSGHTGILCRKDRDRTIREAEARFNQPPED